MVAVCVCVCMCVKEKGMHCLPEYLNAERAFKGSAVLFYSLCMYIHCKHSLPTMARSQLPLPSSLNHSHEHEGTAWLHSPVSKHSSSSSPARLNPLSHSNLTRVPQAWDDCVMTPLVGGERGEHLMAAEGIEVDGPSHYLPCNQNNHASCSLSHKVSW